MADKVKVSDPPLNPLEPMEIATGNEWALRAACTQLRVVEPTWCDVVRCVRVEERREGVDVLPTNAEFGLSTTVHPDSVLQTILDRMEDRLDGAEPRGLDVQPLGFERELLDTLDARNRIILGHTAFVPVK